MPTVNMLALKRASECIHVARGIFIFTRNASTNISDHLPRPSKEYLSKMGEQPVPDQRENEQLKVLKKLKQENDSTLEEQIRQAMKRRSLRMTFWEMFLITFIGSCALNIQRETNSAEEYNDNYKLRFERFERIIKGLSQGDVTIEEIEEDLDPLNERFETVFHLPGSRFEGLRGLDKKHLKEKYHKYEDESSTEVEGSELLAGAIPEEKIKKDNSELKTFL